MDSPSAGEKKGGRLIENTEGEAANLYGSASHKKDKIVFGGKAISLRDSAGSWKSHSWPPPSSEEDELSIREERRKEKRKKKKEKKQSLKLRKRDKSEDGIAFTIEKPPTKPRKDKSSKSTSPTRTRKRRASSGGAYSLPSLVHLLQLRKESDKTGAFPLSVGDPDVKMVKELVATEGKKVLSQPINGNSQRLLHVAVEKGDYKLCKYLLKEGVDVNAKDLRGFTPLHQACSTGSCDMVALLLQLAKDSIQVSAKCRNGSTPLHFLVKHGPKVSLPQIRRQLDFDLDDYRGEEREKTDKEKKGEKEKEKDKERKGRKRKRRVISNYFQVVNLLVNYGCDPMERDNNGNTCMHIAARAGKIAVVEYLVEILGFRMDINARNNKNETCLHLAARKGRDQMVITLMALGVDSSIDSAEGTAYEIANLSKNFTTATLLKGSGSSIPVRAIIKPKKEKDKDISKGGTTITTTTNISNINKGLKSSFKKKEKKANKKGGDNLGFDEGGLSGWENDEYSTSPDLPVISFAALRSGMNSGNNTANESSASFLSSSPTLHSKTPPHSPTYSSSRNKKWYKKGAFDPIHLENALRLPGFNKKEKHNAYANNTNALTPHEKQERKRRHTEGSTLVSTTENNNTNANTSNKSVSKIANPLLQIPDLHKKIRFENLPSSTPHSYPASSSAENSEMARSLKKLRKSKRTIFLRKRENANDLRFILEEEEVHEGDIEGGSPLAGVLHVSKASRQDVFSSILEGEEGLTDEEEEEDDYLNDGSPGPSSDFPTNTSLPTSVSFPPPGATSLSLSLPRLPVLTKEGDEEDNIENNTTQHNDNKDSMDDQFAFLWSNYPKQKSKTQLEMEALAERWELYSRRRRRAMREAERKKKMEEKIQMEMQQAAPIELPAWCSDQVVDLNVGGMRYTTTRATLLGFSAPNIPPHDNYFTSIFSEKYTIIQDETGSYFVDRDGQYFAPVLTYFRTGIVTVPEGMELEAVINEAQYYCIQPLVEELTKLQRKRALARNDITKGEFHSILTRARIKGFMLNMSGMKMRGMNFAYMQLLNVHFSSCDLEGADFSNAILNRARFHAANLRDVKFIHSIFSSHTNPFSHTTNLEGVLFHEKDNAISLYQNSFNKWGYKMVRCQGSNSEIIMLEKEPTHPSNQDLDVESGVDEKEKDPIISM